MQLQFLFCFCIFLEILTDIYFAVYQIEIKIMVLVKNPNLLINTLIT